MNYLNEAPVCAQCKIVSSSWWRWREGMQHILSSTLVADRLHLSLRRGHGNPALASSITACLQAPLMEWWSIFNTPVTLSCVKSIAALLVHLKATTVFHEYLFFYFKACIIKKTTYAVSHSIPYVVSQYIVNTNSETSNSH